MEGGGRRQEGGRREGAAISTPFLKQLNRKRHIHDRCCLTEVKERFEKPSKELEPSLRARASSD